MEEREVDGKIELCRVGKDGTSEHILCPHEYIPHAYRSDCWCEPRHVFVDDPEIGNEKHEGLYYIILHEGPAHRAYFPPREYTEKIFSEVQEPPINGWDNYMANESIDRLLQDVGKEGYVRKAKKLKQGPNETIEEFYSRIKHEIDKGTDELDFEADDIEALHGLLERDDDFELETDEEE